MGKDTPFVIENISPIVEVTADYIAELTIEQLIVDFDSKQNNDYYINDFLKTITHQHDTITHLKQLGGIITKLDLKVKGDTHLQG